MKKVFKLPVLGAAFVIACVWFCCIGQAAQPADPLSTLPADPQQTTQPQWVTAISPNSAAPLFAKAEVDLNSIKQADNGRITAWERTTYEKTQLPSTDSESQIGESLFLIDCKAGEFTFLQFNNRKSNGELVRTTPAPEIGQKTLADVPAPSLISSEVTLACERAKQNWPNDPDYDFHIKPKKVIAPLTAQEISEIDRAIADRKESDSHNIPFVKPLLTAVSGKNVCQAMNGVDGNPSGFELCDAQGMFAHDVYSVRLGGALLLQGIDDATTNGINGLLYGSPVQLQCEPVNQLAQNVTSKNIEAAIQVGRMGPKTFPFDEELKSAIQINLVEIGRHCTLSNAQGVMAKLDVVSP